MEELTTQSFNNLVQAVNDLSQKINEFEIAENYFSDILTNQVAIFGVIVVAAFTLFALFTWFKSKSFIEKTTIDITDQHKKELKDEIKERYDDLVEKIEKQHGNLDEKLKDKYKILDRKLEDRHKTLDKRINADFKAHLNEFNRLDAEQARSYGYFLYNQKSYKVAFIWQIRAAHGFSLISNGDTFVRNALKDATNTVKKIGIDPFLNSDIKGEYQRLFREIDSGDYKLEKKELEEAIKEALKLKT